MSECGVEIHISNTGTVEAIFKALHALHLDAVGRYMAKNTKAVILVDGEKKYQDVMVRHFVAVPPGEHDIGFYFYDGTSAAPAALQQHFNQANARVTVEPGKVTLLDYRLRSLTVATSSLTVTGTRYA